MASVGQSWESLWVFSFIGQYVSCPFLFISQGHILLSYFTIALMISSRDSNKMPGMSQCDTSKGAIRSTIHLHIPLP